MSKGLLLGLEVGGLEVEGVFEGVGFAQLFGYGVELLDGVALAVDAEVEAHVEEVLMIGCVEQRGDDGAVLWAVAFADGGEGQDAGELDFKLDVAVLVEVPEEAVFVVFDSGDGGNDEAAGAAYFWCVGQAAVGVLPEDAEVFFMDADGIGDGECAAAAVGHVRVKVLNVAEAVAAEAEAVGAHAHAVFADVEGVLADLLRLRVAVGDDHLGERGAVEDGPLFALIGVANVVEGEAFAGVEADDDIPLLPGDTVAVHGEAGAFGLGDDERLDVGALVWNSVGGVVARLRWERPLAVFLDANHFHQIEIDNGADAFDGAGVAVVGCVGAEEAERPGEAAGAVFFGAVVAGAPDIDHDE